jgi:HSP20 family protein
MALTSRLLSDAFRDMQRAMSAFEQPSLNTGRLTQAFRYPPTDIKEAPEAYELHAELPGYDKKNIKIELAEDRRTLILTGVAEESKSDEEQGEQQAGSGSAAHAKKEEKQHGQKHTKDEKQVTQKKSEDAQVAKGQTPQWWVNERVVTSFTRSYTFPTPIKADGIKARFEDGILMIWAPKDTAGHARQISID